VLNRIVCLNDPVNFIDPTGELLGAISTGLGAVAAATFAYQAYKAFQKGEEVKENRDKLIEEFDKGIPDPEYAEKLKEDADKTYNEFLDEMKETVKKGMKVPHVSTCP